MASGISAGDVVGLLGGSNAVEAYAPYSRRSRIIHDHTLQPGPGVVLLRWIPDELWSLLDQKGDHRAPRAAILVDLLEHDDPRARREAARALST